MTVKQSSSTRFCRSQLC